MFIVLVPGVGVGEGVAVGDGLAVGDGEGVGVGVGVGDGVGAAQPAKTRPATSIISNGIKNNFFISVSFSFLSIVLRQSLFVSSFPLTTSSVTSTSHASKTLLPYFTNAMLEKVYYHFAELVKSMIC
jgi:hypothetical protein